MVRGLRRRGLVDEDQADAGPVVRVADGLGDPGLRHSGAGGDAEVAGELGGEGLGGRARWHEDVRHRHRVRVADGRDPRPSAAVLDAQTAHSHQGGEAIGFDMGKRTRGRKRHILVDTCGLLLKAVVHAANVQDRAGAKLVLAGLSTAFPLVGLVWVDGGYVNSVDDGLIGWAEENAGVRLEVVARNADPKGFHVLPRRWVVERTFSWLGRCRRLARDYERKTAHAEAMIKVAMIRLMAARLAGEEITPNGPIETEAARRLAEDTKGQ